MEYETTHPWISFQIDLSKAPVPFWLSLGEAKSKCEHLAKIPLLPAVAKKMHTVFLARGALATTAIEGNTLTEKEALKVVRGESKLPKSQQYLKKEIENIVKATNIILDDIEKTGSRDITVEDIKKYNFLVLDGLETEEHVIPGKFAECPVGVAGYKGVSWQEAPQLVGDLCAWLNGATFKSMADDLIIRGIVKAILAHVYIAWIHPFGDGNGRTSRLLEFRFLIEAGVPSPAAHLLSNHYNKTRTEYYRRLDEASKNGGNLLPFLQYAVNGFVDQLKKQLQLVKLQQWKISWISYVHEVIDKKSASSRRQLKLILALSATWDEVPPSKLTTLTPEVAKLYANKTAKTISRDINKLEQLGLLVRVKRKSGNFVRARQETILSFLPRGEKDLMMKQNFEDFDFTEEDELFDI